MKKIFLCATLCALSLVSNADEGMWMLNRIDEKTAEAMKSLGLQLTPDQLYSTEHASLKDCVVDFGDFCSGVVVSPDGLVFTNHHCGYGAIQKLSTPEDDILKNGFVARSRKEERPAEGLFVKFLVRTEECTGRIMRALNKVYEEHPNESTAELDKQYTDSIMAAVWEEFKKTNRNLDCQVRAYYENNAFYVSYYKVYRDIRLVFTATETMGKFGGDTDNWMWPRQTCDFSVFRIYADKNGEPADYNPKNVPLRLKNYARIAMDGYQNGDFCMTVGYPGSTSRYMSSWGIDERVNAINVSTIQVRGKKQEVWKKFMDADRTVGIKYASKWASSSNYWKNSIGMNKAIADLGVIKQKQQLEDKIRGWYNGRKDLKNRFEDMFGKLEQAYGKRRNDVYAAGFFRETFMRGIELYRVAHMLNTMPQDADSTEADLVRSRMESFFKDYDAKLDEATMAALLKNYREQVKERRYWPDCYNTIDSLYGGDEAAYAHDVFSKTICTSLDGVDKLLADSTLRDTDLGLLYADDIPTKMQEISGRNRDASTTIDFNEHLLTQALLEMDQETPHYSDANFTMRLSYGYIQDYTANGTHHQYYTNAQSLLDKAAKQNEIEDYKLEDDIISLMNKGDWGRYADRTTGDMHLCFLSNNDITGGNSGSPMFNGKGELLGLAFDGNWDAMSGDISFDNNLQRCIGVDVRYMLFVIDKWGKAKNLIKELKLK
ncbi:MAG: S46 family peptidase [Bacteroidaceae bacterium]|nr:S46 family peptidase [Bacteroidaceae bacterium]